MKKIVLSLALGFCFQANSQIISTVAGTGTAGYAGDAGQAIAAKLNLPKGVVIDSLGNLFIVDESNNRIRKVNTSGLISTFAGTGVQGFGGDGGAATSAKFYTPPGLCLDAYGNLYIADEDNFRIRKINGATGIINTVAGNGTPGFSGDNGPATSAELLRPYAVAFDAAGNMYIADTQNNRVRKVNSSGIITTIAGNGTAGFAGDNGAATAAELDNPNALAFDAAGNLYIADAHNNRIRKVNTTGIISTFAGTGTASFSGDGGLANAASLNNPCSVTFDAAGNLFIGDVSNNRIRKIAKSTGIISTVVGNGTAGYSGDGGPATSAALNSPVGMAFDTMGNLYFADAINNRIRMATNIGQPAVGIEEMKNISEQINIYPNPASGNFVVETKLIMQQTVNVYDISGKIVLSQAINGTTSIDATKLNAGTYEVKINSKNASVTKKIVLVK